MPYSSIKDLQLAVTRILDSQTPWDTDPQLGCIVAAQRKFFQNLVDMESSKDKKQESEDLLARKWQALFTLIIPRLDALCLHARTRERIFLTGELCLGLCFLMLVGDIIGAVVAHALKKESVYAALRFSAMTLTVVIALFSMVMLCPIVRAKMQEIDDKKLYIDPPLEEAVNTAMAATLFVGTSTTLGSVNKDSESRLLTAS